MANFTAEEKIFIALVGAKRGASAFLNKKGIQKLF